MGRLCFPISNIVLIQVIALSICSTYMYDMYSMLRTDGLQHLPKKNKKATKITKN